MATRPTKFPRWATLNPTDPGSGQDAIIEPAEAKKDSGSTNQEQPPRQDFNWLFNLSNEWLEWIAQEVDACRFAPIGYIDGFKMFSNDEETIELYRGSCRLGHHDVVAPWNKKLINFNAWVDWAEGDAGGLVPNDHSSIAMDWMHLFVISDALGTQLDFAADSSIVASTILANSVIAAAGYTRAKRIGSVAVRDDSMSGNYKLTKFESFGDEFIWVDSSSAFPSSFSSRLYGVTSSHAYHTIKLSNFPVATEFADMTAVPVNGCIAKMMFDPHATIDYHVYSRTTNNYAVNHHMVRSGAAGTQETIADILINSYNVGIQLTSGGPSDITHYNLGYKDFRRDIEYSV